jgi:hypothetical protein
MRIPDIARSQDGLATRRQCVEAGLAYSTLRRGLTDGRLREVLPGTLSFEALNVPDSIHRRIWAAALSTAVPVSHWTAALLHGLDHAHPVLDAAHADPARTPLHVTAPVERRIETFPGHVHRRPLFPEEVVAVDGIAATSLIRTCIDLICWLPRRQSAAFAFRSHQQRWLAPHDVDRAINARSWCPGVVHLRELRPIFDHDAHSAGEWLLLQVAGSTDDVALDFNVPVRCTSGARYVLDAVVRGVRLALEVDGRAYHGVERFQTDRRRQNDLVEDGWTVLRFTWDDLTRRPDDVLARIRRAVSLLAA